MRATNRTASAKYRRTEGRRKTLLKGALRWAGKGSGRSVYAALSKDEWLALWRHVEGRCPICRAEIQNRYEPGSPGRRSGCDHDHRLEKQLLEQGHTPLEALRLSIRGLLCGWCNHRILPILRDDAAAALRIADYLNSPPARTVLTMRRPTDVPPA